MSGASCPVPPALLAAALGRSPSVTDDSEDIGVAQVALTEVPSDVGINQAHQIFGYTQTASGQERGFLFDPTKCVTGNWTGAN
jgi:hypothetical protein